MECYTCRREVPLAHHVKLRGDVTEPWGDGPPPGGPEGMVFKRYVEEGTYRWAVVCPACYHALDSWDGQAEIGGRVYGIAGASRGGKAAVYDDEKYLRWLRRDATRRGLPLL